MVVSLQVDKASVPRNGKYGSAARVDDFLSRCRSLLVVSERSAKKGPDLGSGFGIKHGAVHGVDRLDGDFSTDVRAPSIETIGRAGLIAHGGEIEHVANEISGS